MNKIFAVAALVALPVFSLPAFAADGPSITGGTQMTIQAGQNVDAAIGDGSSASQSIGAIDSGTINGDLTLTITADQNVNAAIGKDTCADQQIGTIGKKSTCGK
jgi:hypothetical protein